jgi:DNA-binding transcriptional MocR family regulator
MRTWSCRRVATSSGSTSGADTTALAARAAEAGVPFVKGADFYADGGGTTCLRLAFSAVPAPRIREGIERLGAVIAS